MWRKIESPPKSSSTSSGSMGRSVSDHCVGLPLFSCPQREFGCNISVFLIKSLFNKILHTFEGIDIGQH